MKAIPIVILAVGLCALAVMLYFAESAAPHGLVGGQATPTTEPGVSALGAIPETARLEPVTAEPEPRAPEFRREGAESGALLVSGRIVDGAGPPAAGARVQAFADPIEDDAAREARGWAVFDLGSAHPAVGLLETLVDELGHFGVYGDVDDGSITLEVFFASQWSYHSCEVGDRDLRIEVDGRREQVPVSIVLDEGLLGDQIAAALVRCEDRVAFTLRPGGRKEGAWQYRSQIPAGRYWLEIKLPGGRAPLRVVEDVEIGEGSVDPRLKRIDMRGLLERVQIEVTLDSGEPLPLVDQLRSSVRVTLPSGEVLDRVEMRRGRVQFACPKPHADVRLEVPGYEPVELRQVSGNRSVLLRPIAGEPR